MVTSTVSNAAQYLVQLDPSTVIPARDTADGPLLLKRSSFPGMINKVLMFPDDLTIAIVETDDYVSLVQSPGIISVENDLYGYMTQTYMEDQFVFDCSEFEEEYLNNSTKRCQSKAPWHLARLNHRKWLVPGINRTLFGNEEALIKMGEVEVFVIDSGIQLDHPEFKNRARAFFSNQESKNGHGTHVAGLINSQTFGIAKNAFIYDVHVLDGDGVGSYSRILEGLAYVGRYRNFKKKCVVNMSIGGPYSHIMNQAVESLMRNDCFVVVAAGNNGQDACLYSPSSANVVTVGATTNTDKLAEWSNWGNCVNILAPGQSIQSLYPNNRTAFMSGTSMAAPLVSGIAAYYMVLEPNNTPYSLRFRIMSESTKGVIEVDRQDTPNVFSYFPYSASCP